MFVILYKQNGPEITEEAVNCFLLVEKNLYILAVLGTTCTVFGGFIGAKITGSEEFRHGGWVGAVSLITGVYMEFVSKEVQSYPLWFTVISTAVIIPAGVLGGYLAQMLKLHSNTQL